MFLTVLCLDKILLANSWVGRNHALPKASASLEVASLKNQNRVLFFWLLATMMILASAMVGCRVGQWSSPTTRELAKSNLVGTYELPPYFIGDPTTLQLKSDDTFEMIAPKSIAQKGTWQIVGNKISLTYQGQGSTMTRLVGYVSDNERGFYLVLWREGDDPDDADVFVPLQ